MRTSQDVLGGAVDGIEHPERNISGFHVGPEDKPSALNLVNRPGQLFRWYSVGTTPRRAVVCLTNHHERSHRDISR